MSDGSLAASAPAATRGRLLPNRSVVASFVVGAAVLAFATLPFDRAVVAAFAVSTARLPDDALALIRKIGLCGTGVADRLAVTQSGDAFTAAAVCETTCVAPIARL